MADYLLVNSNGTTQQIDMADTSRLADDDLLLVNRSGVTYKVTGQDIKSALGGQGNSDEINEIIVTSTDTDCSFTAYGGTYPYLSTAVYVSKTQDFSELELSFQTSFSDESITNVQYAGLDYQTTYYVKVSYTDQVGNRRFSEPVQFTSANIPDFAEYMVTQSSGTLNLSSYPQGAKISIAYISGGSKGDDGDGGWPGANGNENWNGGGGRGGNGGGFRFYLGNVRDMDGVPLSDLLNNGPGVTNLGAAGGGRGSRTYDTGDAANGGPGATLSTADWAVLNEFKGYRFEAGQGGARGIATNPPQNGGNGAGGGGGGIRLTVTGGYDGDNAQPSVPSIPRGQNGYEGVHNQGNGEGGEGFGAGGGGGGGGSGGNGAGKGGNGAAGIAVVKVFFRNSRLLTPADKFIPADPQEY